LSFDFKCNFKYCKSKEKGRGEEETRGVRKEERKKERKKEGAEGSES